MKHAQIHAKLLIVAVIWGLGWPAGRAVAADVTPIVAAWIRYVIVAGLFMFYLQRTEGWSYPSPTQWKNIAFIAFFLHLPLPVHVHVWNEVYCSRRCIPRHYIQSSFYGRSRRYISQGAFNSQLWWLDSRLR